MITSFLFVISVIIFSAVLASVAVLWGDMSYYKRVYKTLPTKDFCLNISLVYADKRNFIWFVDDKDFCLSRRDSVYLFNKFFTFLNPYSAYWYFKYKRWFAKNVNPCKLRYATFEDL